MLASIAKTSLKQNSQYHSWTT